MCQIGAMEASEEEPLLFFCPGACGAKLVEEVGWPRLEPQIHKRMLRAPPEPAMNEWKAGSAS